MTLTLTTDQLTELIRVFTAQMCLTGASMSRVTQILSEMNDLFAMPTIGEAIEELGVTEADIREIYFDYGVDDWVVKLWNHRKLRMYR